MTDPENHYAFLGLPDFDSREHVEAAVERLAKRAAALANAAPEQSQQIRDRLRHIKHDLLTSGERREAYDSTLRGAYHRSSNMGDIPLTTGWKDSDRPTERPVDRTPPTEPRRARPVPRPSDRPLSRSGLRWLAGFLLALALLALGFGLSRWVGTGTPQSSSPPTALATPSSAPAAATTVATVLTTVSPATSVPTSVLASPIALAPNSVSTTPVVLTPAEQPSDRTRAVVAALQGFFAVREAAYHSNDTSELPAVETGAILAYDRRALDRDANNGVHVDISDLAPPELRELTFLSDGTAVAEVYKVRQFLFIHDDTGLPDDQDPQHPTQHPYTDRHQTYFIAYDLEPAGNGWLVYDDRTLS